MQDEEGQILQAHSISAGLDYPGAGPQHAYLRDSGRARYVAVTDAEALAAFREVARAGGHHPGARDRPRARLGARAERGRARPRVPVGRGDKDLAEVLGEGRAVSDRRGDGDRADRRRVRRERQARRADALPDGRLSRPLAESLRIGAGVRAGRRGRDRAGRALLGPARRRPGDPRRGHAARWPAGANVAARARGRARAVRAASRWCSCATRTWSSRPGSRRSSSASQRSGRVRADRARPAPRARRPRCSRRASARGIALVPLVAPTTTPERLAAIGAQRARLPLHGLGRRHHRRAPRRSPSSFAEVVGAGARRARRCRSRSASASAPPSRRARPPTRAPTA